jgi:hypothetical protein
LQQEIGLGKAEEIKKLTIYWQNSSLQTFTNIMANQKIRIIEKEKTPRTISYNKVKYSKLTKT